MCSCWRCRTGIGHVTIGGVFHFATVERIANQLIAEETSQRARANKLEAEREQLRADRDEFFTVLKLAYSWLANEGNSLEAKILLHDALYNKASGIRSRALREAKERVCVTGLDFRNADIRLNEDGGSHAIQVRYEAFKAHRDALDALAELEGQV